MQTPPLERKKTATYVHSKLDCYIDVETGEKRPLVAVEPQFFDPNHHYVFDRPSAADYARWSKLSY